LKTLVVVQARMGSTRLPGKVLQSLAGKPMLERMIERLRATRSKFELCVATTTELADDPIRTLCRRIGVDCFSGHPTDLLDRHVAAARRARADVIVKIPSDCPLIDPAAVDRVLHEFEATAGYVDLVTNLLPPTWPDGNDVEVVQVRALETAFREAYRPLEREHTTPFIWENPKRFRIANVRWETGLDYSRTYRFTVDYAEDLALVSAVFTMLHDPKGPPFSVTDMIELLELRPDIALINACHVGSSWQKRSAPELRSMRVERGALRWIDG
jgi:spore coat polysaccharide biosynthesis protein SpsF